MLFNSEKIIIVLKDVERMPTLLTRLQIQNLLNISEDGAYELMQTFPPIPVLKRQFVLKTDLRKWLLQKT